MPGRTGYTPRFVARWIADSLAPASINRRLAALKRIFSVAIADGLCEANPVSRVKLLRENNQRVRLLNDDEETRLRAAIGDEWWPLVAIAIHTGLRQGEQFGLRWEHVDFATGILTVPRSKHGERRTVPLNETAREILRTLPSRLKSPFVFPSDTGETPLDPRNVMRRVFLPALRQAAIEAFRWHDLRHTFASR